MNTPSNFYNKKPNQESRFGIVFYSPSVDGFDFFAQSRAQLADFL
jgi:hypothetical protein